MIDVLKLFMCKSLNPACTSGLAYLTYLALLKSLVDWLSKV